MPVQSVKINRPRADGQAWENNKPVYLCEECKRPASFGFTVTTKNRRTRQWFCTDHRLIGEALLSKA